MGRILDKQFNGISDREVKFVLEYAMTGNGKQSVINAGFSPNAAAVYANKLLAKPRIKAILRKLMKQDAKKFEIHRHEILEQLASCALRDGKDFVDDKGRIIGSVLLKNGEVVAGIRINDLPDSVSRAIDGIEQEREVTTHEDGTVVEMIKTKLKLSPKAQAIRMCMEHKGLFAPTQGEQRVIIDWGQLQQQATSTLNVDPIQRRLEQEKEVGEE